MLSVDVRGEFSATPNEAITPRPSCLSFTDATDSGAILAESLDEARRYAHDLLVRQLDTDERPGELYPLYTKLRTFDRFGTDVSQYFHFMYHSKSFFVFLFHCLCCFLPRCRTRRRLRCH